MTDNSMDISVTHLYDVWCLYRRGKKRNREMDEFEHNLENNLLGLARDLQKRTYTHGTYRQFVISEGKKRLVSVASVRDRVVHRLVYEYIGGKFDKSIHFDAWSGRKGKGLLKAIRRAQSYARKYGSYWVLKVDIKKFFDSVDHGFMLRELQRICLSEFEYGLCRIIVGSFNSNTRVGMPIGNVTSQIFAHVYLGKIDKLLGLNSVKFVRYGDDILVFCKSENIATKLKSKLCKALGSVKLCINEKSSCLRKVRNGINFLGCVIYPKGRKLQKRTRDKIMKNINNSNLSSYLDLVKKHDKISLCL